MEILFLMIIVSLILAATFLIIFIMSLRNGQFDDDHSPAVRMLLEDKQLKKQVKKEKV